MNKLRQTGTGGDSNTSHRLFLSTRKTYKRKEYAASIKLGKLGGAMAVDDAWNMYGYGKMYGGYIDVVWREEPEKRTDLEIAIDECVKACS